MVGRIPVGEMARKLWGWRVRFVFLILSATVLASLMGAMEKRTDIVGVVRYDSGMMSPVGSSERFYTEAGDHMGRGFSVVDYTGGPQFLTAFKKFGAENVLGYPVSRPFLAKDGLFYQITQRAMLQWAPDIQTARLANLYQILQDAGLDDVLFGQSVPRPLLDGAASYEDAKLIRMKWMTNQAIKTAFLQNPLVPGNEAMSIELYGLPMSRPQSFGSVVSQRFQRVAFQHSVEDLPGGRPVGTVTPVNGGELLREHLYAGTEIIKPHLAGQIDIVGVMGGTRSTDGLEEALPVGYNVSEDDLVILRALKVLAPLSPAREGLEAARVLQTNIAFTMLPDQVLGAFSSANTIYLSNDLRNQDVRVVAVVLLHELVHLADWRADAIGLGFNACIEAEVRAIVAEATAWASLVGGEGKHPALTRLERFENLRLQLLQSLDGSIIGHATKLYKAICTV